MNFSWMLVLWLILMFLTGCQDRDLLPPSKPAADDSLVQPLLPGKESSEWRSRFQEPEQSLEQWQEGAHRSWGKEGTRLVVLLPHRNTSSSPDFAYSQALSEGMNRFLGRSVDLLSPSRHRSDSAWRPWRGEGRGQWEVPALFPLLQPLCPADSLTCLALVEEDLFTPGLTWILGMSPYQKGIGVLSLHRISPPGGAESVARRRILLLSLHETLHQLGITHCQTSSCIMNGMASVADCDRTPIHLCPVDAEKMRQALHPTQEK